jgi:hypothetical protein
MKNRQLWCLPCWRNYSAFDDDSNPSKESPVIRVIGRSGIEKSDGRKKTASCKDIFAPISFVILFTSALFIIGRSSGE